MWLGAGSGGPGRELGRARPEEGVGALCAKNSICWRFELNHPGDP
jgi:hypothetical protein